MAARVGGFYLLATTSLSTIGRVGGHYQIAAMSSRDPYPARVGGHYHVVASSNRNPHPVRVGGHYIVTIASLANAFFPSLLDSDNEIFDIELVAGEPGTGGGGEPGDDIFFPILLESDNTIFGVIGYTLLQSTFPIPEHNPYRPRIPEQFIRQGDDIYDFQEENQQILREQHNLTQVGDSTFPYQLMVQAHDTKHYKLGAVGRFYHDVYGIIQARYVKFDKMADVDAQEYPVGLSRRESNLDWVVTNDLTFSTPDLVVGISAPYALPVDGQFGWVIVDGPILQQVINNSTTAAIGESLVWDATGSVSNSAEGRILGRRVNPSPVSTTLLAGQMWVRVESLSEASITRLANQATQDLRDLVADLQNSLSILPAAGELNALNHAIDSLRTQLTLEVSARRAVDAAIEAQIAALDVVDSTVLDNALAIVANNLSVAVSSLLVQIAAVRDIAIAALEASGDVSIADITNLQNQINTILEYLAREALRPKGKFPVVDGAVPPNLVYLDDGSLVYTETF